jgi:hypothetical protein
MRGMSRELSSHKEEGEGSDDNHDLSRVGANRLRAASRTMSRQDPRFVQSKSVCFVVTFLHVRSLASNQTMPIGHYGHKVSGPIHSERFSAKQVLLIFLVIKEGLLVAEILTATSAEWT